MVGAQSEFGMLAYSKPAHVVGTIAFVVASFWTLLILFN